MNEHPDEYLSPLESEPDAFNRARWAMAYAVAHTTGFYADEFKEHADSIRFTIHDYRDVGFCTDTWHAIDVGFVNAMPQDGLQRHFIEQLETLPRWGEDSGATGKTVQGDLPQ